MDAKALLSELVSIGVADIFIITGKPLSYKRGTVIEQMDDKSTSSISHNAYNY